ncbi:MAG: hypothetical protein ACK5B9_04535 [Flavobacteriia bacterium]|jgi:hypothetical protein
MVSLWTRFTLIDENGEPHTLQSFDNYVWLPKGTKVKHDKKEYTVDDYRVNLKKCVMDIILK